MVVVVFKGDEVYKPSVVKSFKYSRGCGVLILCKQRLQSIKHHTTMTVIQLQG